MKNRKETNRIIFHHSLSDFGDVDIIRQWHIDRGFVDIGYHFVVPLSGSLQSGRKLQLIGAHAGTPRPSRNGDSIGVCLVGNFANTPPTDSQINECARLYHDLCRAYSIKLTIEYHHEQCPGVLLDRAAFTKTLYDSI
jgi:hypothetical protein